MAPELMRRVTEETVKEDEDDDLGLDNPTPYMKEVKRKSMMVTKKLSPVKVIAKNVNITKIAKPTQPKMGFTGTTFFAESGDEESCQIYLMQSDPMDLEFKSIRKAVPKFPGSNLTVLHTPIEWDPTHVFNLTKLVKTLNKSAKLDTFLMLVGCGLDNVHMYKEALRRHTGHVQFVVFERQDMNVKTNHFGRLRETTAYFLLAYFFPGCQDEESVPPIKMVRDGFTNCIKTDNTEDLENRIIEAFSEQGDWVLDLCCKSRELSLAAQKTGRFALAVDPERENLMHLRDKALAIAKFHDKNFTNKDGVIINFD